MGRGVVGKGVLNAAASPSVLCTLHTPRLPDHQAQSFLRTAWQQPLGRGTAGEAAFTRTPKCPGVVSASSAEWRAESL